MSMLSKLDHLTEFHHLSCIKILTRKLTFTRLEAADKVPKLYEGCESFSPFFSTLYFSSFHPITFVLRYALPFPVPHPFIGM